MNENTENINPITEDESILPDGWTEEADYFNPASWSGSSDAADKDDDFFADVLDDEPTGGETQSKAEDTQSGEEPTTAPVAESEFSGAADNPAAEEAPTTEPDTSVAEPASTKHRFKARIDHEDVDVEVDADELPTIYQKSMATDRYQQKLAKVNPLVERMERMAKNNGYETVEAMLDAQEAYDREVAVEKMVKEGAPKAIAEDYYDRHYGSQAPAKQQTAEQAADVVEQAAPTADTPPARDFAAEVRELWSMRPDLKGTTIPSEVAKAAAEGQNLSLAYFAYEAKQAKATAERLQQENNTYKQNAATAAKAPVKGVSGGGSTDTQPEDPLLAGFDSGW